jgi:hypothetical protein
VHASRTESAAPFERAKQRCIPSASHSHAERLCSVDEIKLKAMRVAIKSIGDTTEQPH